PVPGRHRALAGQSGRPALVPQPTPARARQRRVLGEVRTSLRNGNGRGVDRGLDLQRRRPERDLTHGARDGKGRRPAAPPHAVAQPFRRGA
ncbi:hypothetical protein LTR53_020324, partial [Teratosphaeriaceae sp. CCFEE 6253]